MARPALRLLVVPALVASLALIPAGCGSSSSGQGEARNLLRTAFRKQVRSSDVSLAIQAKLNGLAALGDRPLRLSFAGPLRSNGRRSLPSLDWRVRAQGAGLRFAGRLIVVPHNTYVQYKGATYEVGERIVRRFERRLRRDPAQSLSLGRIGVDPAQWIEDGKVENGGLVGGDPTRKVSGKLDVGKVLRSLNRLLESPQLRGELPSGRPAPRLSPKQIEAVRKAVRDPRFEVNVGKHDDVVRRLRSEIDFKLTGDQSRSAGGLEGGRITLRVEQTHIDGNQRIIPPSGGRPLPELLRRLGIPPGLLGSGSTSGRPSVSY
jgi:hypothetical protein